MDDPTNIDNWLENLIIAASKQTEGHFSDFGGTIFTENNWLKRLAAIMRSIWADGLGGYWAERSWQTMALSLSMVYILSCGIKELRLRIDKKTILVFISLVLFMQFGFTFSKTYYIKADMFFLC